MRKRLAVGVLATALLAPAGAGAAHHVRDYGMPRAMPADYATAQGVLPRSTPSDVAGVGAREYGMPRAMPSDYEAYFGSQRKPLAGVEWRSAGIGAAITLGALLAAALAVMLIRRDDRVRHA